jgi:hypothetical protein
MPAECGKGTLSFFKIDKLFGQTGGLFAFFFQGIFHFRFRHMDYMDIMINRGSPCMALDEITIERIIPVRVPARQPKDLFTLHRKIKSQQYY